MHRIKARTMVVFGRHSRATPLVGRLRRTDLANILPEAVLQLAEDGAMAVGWLESAAQINFVWLWLKSLDVVLMNVAIPPAVS